ncbi:starch-binding outer membrane lipoprotein SusD [Bacteroides caecimuris]|uniref:Starch-binding outer membrane lipoprotein SusD n=1 Tax=Bacteroides caecimuris TaxID=1796613 RepID=A0A1C7GVK9_9BACE|nr:starch-binding outer membrane lipoprotein SusD [Bacteroides caecimuris]ANU56259.1 starch-binding outer membrane lipoprotein SusD [Bacteroides caecimuris]NDO58331.1 starch-binding outer membrane lipoprotein SusD [Bacteroides caecimuris]OXE63723.1 starch-binding outer membrane lipoprotein SusD [Bacteroides caecimuris]QQR18899.1 starch-binding outer membrane lipoprotein SusD [Bacteroides caecimuris]UQA31927.1 starch-binding outer membrane lipoprotein SusD [Bacteroides caecimuris]
MKIRYIKQLFSAALIASLSLGVTSCINDLNISPIDPQTDGSFDQQGVFVKGYAMLGLTGQKGIAGSADLDGQDEGESGFYRTTFNCNELPSDECLWAWQDNQDIPQFTNINWNSSSQRTEWVYVRLGYNITQYNFFLDQTEGKTDEETLRQRAEIRFLRALHYWYFLDLFGKAPFKEHFNNELPVEKKGAELYAYIQNELNDIEGNMYEPRQAPFGRADKAANWLLRARLYLNAGVYTGQTDYAKAEEYAGKVIDSGYELCDNYAELFMADNDENPNAMQEIILPIRQDGVKTRNHGGSVYLICATRIAGMPRMGTTNGWSCIFARAAMVQKFFPDLTKVPVLPDDVEIPNEGLDTDAQIDAFDAQYGLRTEDIIQAAGDDRAMLYSGVGGGRRKLQTDAITGFTNGLSIVKWQNYRSDGKPVNHTEYPDTDIPLFRLAEAYLTRAEALFRQDKDATADINKLRSRANCTRMVETVTEQELIDEWSREFYMEGRRRSDLVRFDMFTTNKYVWDWKGGTMNGAPVASHYNVFPVPVSDLNNNPNMSQNSNY